MFCFNGEVINQIVMLGHARAEFYKLIYSMQKYYLKVEPSIVRTEQIENDVLFQIHFSEESETPSILSGGFDAFSKQYFLLLPSSLSPCSSLKCELCTSTIWMTHLFLFFDSEVFMVLKKIFFKNS